ncbi:HET-domain-containing protein [Ustulina deusta]|nr:HET-domain-containing protein [Ustulina deusta]
MSIPYLNLSRDRREIRLLELLPCPGAQYARIPCCRLLQQIALPEAPRQFAQILCCQLLEQIGLREAPRYSALSYAWGNAETNRVMKVDDIFIRIPQNLFNALITLRPPQSPLRLWVDYLCINQQNDEEKAWQVALMRDIYSQADQVLAWLGPGDGESQRAMEYLDTLGEEAHLCGFYHDDHIGDAIWERLATIYSTHSYAFSGDSIPTPLREALDAEFDQHIHVPLTNLFHKINGWSSKGKGFPVREMKNLLKRPWFGRVWVLQEIALSRRATFICGTARIDIVRLRAAVNAYRCFWTAIRGRLMANDGGSWTLYHNQIFMEFFFRATTMVNAPKVMMIRHFPLIALLRLTCVGSPNLQKHGPHHLDSSDPRDKIFALLGLASDRRELSKKGVNPDYTKSCREVYIFTTSVLLQQGHLSLLSHVQPHQSSAHGNLPSWVPDWYQPITVPLQIVKDDHITLYPEFCASGTNSSLPIIKVNRNASGIYGISLEGYVCDKVHSVGLFPRRVSSWDVPLGETGSWPQEWLVEILRLTYQVKGNFPSFEERLQAVTRAAVGGTTNNLQGDFVRIDENKFVEAGHLLQRSIHRVKNRQIKVEASKFLARTMNENVSNTWILRISSDIIGRSLQRLPFITATGRLGLGYDNIQAGDVVAIIRGAQVPYILRPQQTGAYNLISEAYVDGIMDGEALQGAIFTWLDIV